MHDVKWPIALILKSIINVVAYYIRGNNFAFMCNAGSD